MNSNVLTHEAPLVSSKYTPWTKLGSHATVCLSLCLRYESKDVIMCLCHVAPCSLLLGNNFPRQQPGLAEALAKSSVSRD